MANKRSLWGYRGDDHNPFIKVTLTDFKLLARTRTMFERGEVDFRGMFRDQNMTYESNIPYTLRFMIDHKVGRTVMPAYIQAEQAQTDFRYELARNSRRQVRTSRAIVED
jgi:DNA polymerase delta subunit 1